LETVAWSLGCLELPQKVALDKAHQNLVRPSTGAAAFYFSTPDEIFESAPRQYSHNTCSPTNAAHAYYTVNEAAVLVFLAHVAIIYRGTAFVFVRLVELTRSSH
jgi:hypothetical protein